MADERHHLVLDMVLHCPACGMQHIDAETFETHPDEDGFPITSWVWTNPPHRSHLCAGCGHIWRPADVPTNGVAAVQTRGKADSFVASTAAEKITTLRARRLQLIELLECERQGWETLAESFKQTGGSSLVPLLTQRAESLRAVIDEEKGLEL